MENPRKRYVQQFKKYPDVVSVLTFRGLLCGYPAGFYQPQCSFLAYMCNLVKFFFADIVFLNIRKTKLPVFHTRTFSLLSA